MVLTCCGRQFKDSAALAAHKKSQRHRGGGSSPAAKPKTGKTSRPRAAPATRALMSVDMRGLYRGVPKEAVAVLNEMPPLSAEGSLFVVGMLSPSSSDLSVNIKLPDHISTRSMTSKKVNAAITLQIPQGLKTGEAAVWNCLLVRLPCYEIEALAIAWGDAPTPSTIVSIRNIYGIDTWNECNFGTESNPILYYCQAITAHAISLQPEFISSGSQTIRDYRSNVEVLANKAAETADDCLWKPVTAKVLTQKSLVDDAALLRMVAAGMTVTFTAPKLRDQGMIHSADCGRMEADYRNANVHSGTAGNWGNELPTGWTMTGGANGAVRYSGRVAWFEDFDPASTLQQTDVVRWTALRGSYSVLYPRASEHPYMSAADLTVLASQRPYSGAPSSAMGLLQLVDANGDVYPAGVRIDATYGTKVVRYSGIGAEATLSIKNVSHWEIVPDPDSSWSEHVSTAFAYDAQAMDIALGFAGSMPVMFPEQYNDFAGFWKSLKGVVAGMPRWISKTAVPWVRDMTGAVSSAVNQAKSSYGELSKLI